MDIIRNRYSNILPIILLFAAVVAAIPGWSAVSVDNSIYAELLGKYVHNGQVNYDGLKKEERRLDQYLKVLENVDPDSLSRDEQFAFYANIYNAWTVKLILTGYPDIDSIKDLGSLFKSPWKKKLVRINGKVLTLDNVEHDILRPQFKDARVHFAINCAAYSCPPLLPEPFTAGKLDEQLTDATRSFINNPKRTYLDGNTLYVSKIFKWFAEDFNHDPYTFVVKYAEGNFKNELEAGKGKIKVKYLNYDWSLNNRPQ
jgi:hypothetical protein